tara:strand:- start:164 stop:457 length:294 start_codon:yes stop_codon:yes gene_type:complete
METNMSKNKQPKDNRTIMERLEAMGLKFAPKDDPMYKLGPSIRFVSRKSRKIKKEETIDERLFRESGVTPVSQDHPIYKRKPSIRFISKKSGEENEK